MVGLRYEGSEHFVSRALMLVSFVTSRGPGVALTRAIELAVFRNNRLHKSFRGRDFAKSVVVAWHERSARVRLPMMKNGFSAIGLM